jgi:rRNA maturation protein Rpf1
MFEQIELKISKKEKRDLVLLIEYEGEPGHLIFKNTLEYGKVIIKTRQGEPLSFPDSSRSFPTLLFLCL